MKSLKLVTTAILLTIITSGASAQFLRTVYGDGQVVREQRDIKNFTGVRVSSGIDVYLRQGDRESVTVEADENLHDYIITEVRDGVLQIRTDVTIRKAEQKKVYITMDEIRSVAATSAGDITGETLIRSDRLKISVNSAGDIKLDVKAEEVDVNISSSGDVTLSGEARLLKADLSSAGDLNAINLEVEEADISVSSAGDADINVTKKLSARASSAGNINYRGNPEYVNTHSSSAGGIHRR